MNEELKRLRAWAATPEGAEALRQVEEAHKPRREGERPAHKANAVLRALEDVAATVVPSVRWKNTSTNTTKEEP
jgi:hypothetical protein